MHTFEIICIFTINLLLLVTQMTIIILFLFVRPSRVTSTVKLSTVGGTDSAFSDAALLIWKQSIGP